VQKHGASNRDTRLYLAAQQLISSSDNNKRAAQWADHQWNVELTGSPTTPTLLECTSQEQPAPGLTASAPVSGVSAPTYTNWV